MTIDNRPTKGDDARNRPETARTDDTWQMLTGGAAKAVSSSGEAICPSRERVKLWQAVNALGVAAENSAHMAYGRAINDALNVLERYGFGPQREPYLVEPFDVTQPKNIHGDAALAMDVLELFARGGSFTTGDALKTQALIGRLLTVMRHEREHAGKSEAGRRVAEDRLADMTTERDALRESCERYDKRIAELVEHEEVRRSAAMKRKADHRRRFQVDYDAGTIEAIADSKVLDCPACGGSGHIDDVGTNADPVDRLRAIMPDTPTDVLARGVAVVAEAMQQPGIVAALAIALADSEAAHNCRTIERDEYATMVDTAQAATEEAIQIAKDRTAERDAAAENARREANRADCFREALLGVRDDLHNENGLNLLSIADTVWHGSAETTVDYIDAALMFDGEKPRCRVVTSPRFYSDEQRERAITDLLRVEHTGGTVRSILGRIIGGRIVDAVAAALGMARAR